MLIYTKNNLKKKKIKNIVKYLVFWSFSGNDNCIRYRKNNHNIIYFNRKIRRIQQKYLFNLNLLRTVFQITN